jgi:hypothetical protein
MNKKLILCLIGIFILLAFLTSINLLAFRSDTPSLSIVTLLGSALVLIYIPYNKIFKNK